MKTSWLLILMAAMGTFTLGCGGGDDAAAPATPAPAADDAGDDAGEDAEEEAAPAE